MATINLPCPACEHEGLNLFYEQAKVPLNSMLLLKTAEEAKGFPTGALRVAVCPECGFVTNTAFDPGSAEYSVRYEASQAYSPRFNEFATGLAQRWIDKHDIHNKVVLEIGCD